MNDVVLNIQAIRHTPAISTRRFKSLSFNTISRLGQELFSAVPDLPVSHPERACRLASLIIAKAPAINAARFTAPWVGCEPGAVKMKYCHLDFHLMVDLWRSQEEGELDHTLTERHIWGRLAA